MSFTELGLAMNEYEQKFREMPPVFGYSEDELLPAINKAIDTGVVMPGMDEIIEKKLNLSEKDKGTIKI